MRLLNLKLQGQRIPSLPFLRCFYVCKLYKLVGDGASTSQNEDCLIGNILSRIIMYCLAKVGNNIIGFLNHEIMKTIIYKEIG